MSNEIFTMNKFAVGVLGDRIVIVLPPRGPISRDDALLLAAHLVALADDDDKFPAVLDAVRNT